MKRLVWLTAICSALLTARAADEKPTRPKTIADTEGARAPACDVLGLG